MADQKIELPNGDQLLFPAEMPDTEIQAAIETEYPQFKASARSTLPTFDRPAFQEPDVRFDARGLSTQVGRAQDILVDRAYAATKQPAQPQPTDFEKQQALLQQLETNPAKPTEEMLANAMQAGGPYRKPDSNQFGAMDIPKTVTAAIYQSLGLPLQAGGELLARGVNVAGEALGYNPNLRAMNPLQTQIDSLLDSRTPVAKRAEAQSQITGELLKPGTWSFGDNPSALGYVLQGYNAVAQAAPSLALALSTAGLSLPQQFIVGSTFGGMQGFGGALDQERQAIARLSDSELMQTSELYAALRQRGVAPTEARNAVADAAALGGGIGNGTLSGLEQGFENILVGALTRGKLRLPSFGAGTTGRVATGVGGGAVFGGIEESAEQAGQNLASNVAIGGERPIGQDTLQNAIMGAVGQGVAGGVVGAIPPAETPAVAPPTLLRDELATILQGPVPKLGKEERAALQQRVRENLRELLHNPSPELIAADIRLNKLLGGENETLSARIGKAKDKSKVAELLAKGLDSLDPGHIERALADIRKETEQHVTELAAHDESMKDLLPPTTVKVTSPEDVAVANQRVNLQPTEAQKEAGNYAKGHISWNGLNISIENPAGSTRSGLNDDGTAWNTTMPNDYGYIKRTTGADGDQVDVYLGPNVNSPTVFIVDQIDPATGKFDEHKNMLGFDTVPEAIAAYQGGFSDGSGEARMGAITQVSLDDFKAWLKDGKTDKAVTYVNRQKARAKNVQPVEAAQTEIPQAGIIPTPAIPDRGDVPLVRPSDAGRGYPEYRGAPASAPSPAVGTGDGTREAENISLGRRHTQQKPVEEHRQAERRTHPTERKKVSEMTHEELRYALLTDHLTETNNRRAYEEAAKLPIQASVDVDSLKWVNDNLGHAAGDELLKTVAAALKAQTGETYHISGDEFIVQGRTVRAVNVALKAAQEALRSAKLEATDQAGNKTVLNGVGFSYGTGKTLAVAEEGLHAAKASRERAGQRAARGETPPGVVITPKETPNAQTVRSNEGQVRARRTQGQPRVQRSPEQGGGDLQQPASRPAGEQQVQPQAIQKADPAPALQSVAPPVPAKPTGLQSLRAPLEVLVRRVTPAQSTLGKKIDLRPAITRTRALMNGTREPFEPQAAQALREIAATIKTLLAPATPTTVKQPEATYQVEKSAQTETPEFKRWFGDSKVVDAEGKPLVVYRGESTGNLFEKFDLRQTNAGVGFFFAEDRAEAEGYAKTSADVREFYLRGEKVLDLTDPYSPKNRAFLDTYRNEFDEWIDRYSGEEISPESMLEAGSVYDYEGTGSGRRWNRLFTTAEGMGYDAVRVIDATDGVTAPVWVVFEPTQIKSATGNIGTFDPKDANILKQETAGYVVSQPDGDAIAVRPDPAEKDVYYVTAKLESVGTRTLPTEIKTVEDAVRAFSYLPQYAVEHYDAIVTDEAGTPLAIIGSFKGAATQTSVFPSTVLQELALVPGAKILWAAHNHPSGKAQFSQADRSMNSIFADLLQGSGVDYRGLFAMAQKNKQTEFAFVDKADNADEDQILRLTEPKDTQTVHIQERIVSGEPTEFSLNSPQAAKRFMPQISKGNAGIVLLSAQYQPVAFVALGPDEVFPLRENDRFLKLVNRIAKTNAGAAVIVNPNNTISAAHLDNLAAGLSPLDIKTLDAINYTYDPDGGVRDAQSLAEKGTLNPLPFFLSKANQAALDEAGFGTQRQHQTTPYEALTYLQKTHPTWTPAITQVIKLGDQGKRGGLILNSQTANLYRAAELIARKRGVPVESIAPGTVQQFSSDLSNGYSFSQGKENIHVVKIKKTKDAVDFAGEHGGRLSQNMDGSWTVTYVGEVAPGAAQPLPVTVENLGPASKDGWTQGFYSPELGIAFINTDHLSEREVPGVILHEVLHQTATDKETIALGKEVLKRIKTIQPGGKNDIYLRVKERMEQAGVAGDANEAANYLVEEAMGMGSHAGHSHLDHGFWAWAQKALPRTAILTLKRWIAAVRAALYKRGLIVKVEDLKVDDMAAIAVGNLSELAAGTRPAASEVLMNIGLAVNDGSKITPETAKAAVEKLGAQIISEQVRQSNTEPTLILKLSRPLTPEEANKLSVSLKQEAVAQRVDGVGEIYGPQAENWRPFNPDYFLTFQAALKPGEVPPLKATHFSQQKRLTLRGAMFGTGLRGAERTRLAQATDSRIKTRIAFYVDEGQGVFPEAGVGAVRHDVTLTNLYDAAKNPLRLPAKTANEFESAVLDHGFSGYYIEEAFTRQGAAVLLGDAAQRVDTQVQQPTQFQKSMRALTDQVKQALETKAFEYVDEFGPLEKWQKTLGKVPADQDAMMAQQRYSGIVAARVEDFHDDMLNPFFEALHASGIPYQEVEQYLYAKRAPIVNSNMEKINPGQTALSGMTDDEASAVLSQAEQDGSKQALEALAKQVYAITAKTRENLVQGGLLAPEERDAWEAKGRYYVPLHRDEINAPQPVLGKGFSIKGPESKRALGSEREATNILAHTFAQHEASIIRVEKNKVSRAMFELLSANPDKKVGQVDSPDIKKVLDKSTGTVAFRVDPFYKNQPHVLGLKIDGEEHTVSFNMKEVPAQRMAYAFKNLGGKELGEVTILVGKFTRFLATMSTSANPVFLARNFMRDLQTAAVNLRDTPIQNKTRVLVNVPAAMRGFYAMSKDNLKSPWAKHAREFRDAGGQVGWLAQYKDIEDRAQHYKDLVHSMRPGALAASTRAMKFWWSLVEDANAAVENAVRLSAYVTAREEGISEAEAAMIAKNLTVNFNIRGAKSVELNMWYMFAKASINGTARMFRAAKNPKVRKIMGGMVVVGFLLDALARGLAGDDDDDGENDYDQLAEYTKASNWVFWVAGRPVTVPAPYGLNFFPNVGRKVSQLLFQKGYHPLDAAGDLAQIAVNNYSPIGSGGSLLQTVAPTIADPFIQLAENKNFAGQPIRKTQMGFGPDKPEYQMGFKSSSIMSQAIAEWLNANSGGNAARPGIINLNPSVMDFAVASIFGGAGKTYTQVLSLPAKLAADKEIEAREVPFVNIFLSAKPQQQVQRKYYEALEQVQTVAAEYKDPMVISEDWKKEHAGEIALIGYSKRVEARLKKLNGWEKDLPALRDYPAGLNNLEAQIRTKFPQYTEELDKGITGGKRTDTIISIEEKILEDEKKKWMQDFNRKFYETVVR